MMKKNILTQITLLLSFYTFGQVGIGTTNPQGILHIDAATNTVLGTTSTHTDDFIITSTGNVGIGTLAPSTKLEINSSTAGSIKIVDGTQGEGKVLVSDATGIGTWQELPIFKYVTSGNFLNMLQVVILIYLLVILIPTPLQLLSNTLKLLSYYPKVNG